VVLCHKLVRLFNVVVRWQRVRGIALPETHPHGVWRTSARARRGARTPWVWSTTPSTGKRLHRESRYNVVTITPSVGNDRVVPDGKREEESAY